MQPGLFQPSGRRLAFISGSKVRVPKSASLPSTLRSAATEDGAFASVGVFPHSRKPQPAFGDRNPALRRDFILHSLPTAWQAGAFFLLPSGMPPPVAARSARNRIPRQ
jgi:hypothetical protein